MRDLSAALKTASAAQERTPLVRLTVRNLRLWFNPSTEWDGNLPVNANPAMGFGEALVGDTVIDASDHIHEAVVRETGGSFYVYYREVTNLEDWTGAWTQLSAT